MNGSCHILGHDIANLSQVQKVLVAASCLSLSFADEVFQKNQRFAKFIWVPRYPKVSHGFPWYPGIPRYPKVSQGIPSPKELSPRCGVAPRPEDDHDCEDYEAVDSVDHELFEEPTVVPWHMADRKGGTHGVPQI